MMRAFQLLCVLTLAAVPNLAAAAPKAAAKPNRIKIEYVAAEEPGA